MEIYQVKKKTKLMYLNRVSTSFFPVYFTPYIITILCYNSVLEPKGLSVAKVLLYLYFDFINQRQIGETLKSTKYF